MRLFKKLKVRILESIITWSEMGKQAAQAKEVYSRFSVDGERFENGTLRKQRHYDNSVISLPGRAFLKHSNDR